MIVLISKQDVLNEIVRFSTEEGSSVECQQLYCDVNNMPAYKEPKWIPVSERLPEENITVLGTTRFDDIYKTELYDDCGEKKWYANGNFDVPIVAWMPLPTLYEPRESEE